MRLSFVWWNTGLSPSRKPGRAQPEEKSLAVGIVAYFALELKADVICLGEIANGDIQEFQANWEALGYLLINGTQTLERSAFDTCMLVRADVFKVLDFANISAGKGRAIYKICQRLDLQVIKDGVIIHLFVSHWPSRLHLAKNDANRHWLGIKLRTEIESIWSHSPKNHILVVGDFNDEPFDESLAEHLMASRDRALVARRPHLLYNPFWRHLGSPEPYRPNGNCSGVHGSYYYKSGLSNRWHTFDQMIFSASLIGNSTWHLHEEGVQILKVPELMEKLISAKSIFDHLPIMGVIERE